MENIKSGDYVIHESNGILYIRMYDYSTKINNTKFHIFIGVGGNYKYPASKLVRYDELTGYDVNGNSVDVCDIGLIYDELYVMKFGNNKYRIGDLVTVHNKIARIIDMYQSVSDNSWIFKISNSNEIYTIDDISDVYNDMPLFKSTRLNGTSITGYLNDLMQIDQLSIEPDDLQIHLPYMYDKNGIKLFAGFNEINDAGDIVANNDEYYILKYDKNKYSIKLVDLINKENIYDFDLATYEIIEDRTKVIDVLKDKYNV